MSIFLCLVSNVTRVYLPVSYVQCYPSLSFCVLCPMLPISIFLCIAPNVARFYISVSCVQCSPCLSFCVMCSMLPLSMFLCLVPNVSRVYLSVSCAQCYRCLSFCVLCQMLPVSIFLFLVPNVACIYRSVSCAQCNPFLVPNVARVYSSLSCAQCYPCLSFCVLCPMLPVSIFLCLKIWPDDIDLWPMTWKINRVPDSPKDSVCTKLGQNPLKGVELRVFTRMWRTDGRTDGNVTISLRNFVGDGIIQVLCSILFL